MNMFVRLFWLLATAKRRGRLSAWHVSRRTYTVRPRDLDIYLHMTNSAYLSFLDLGRMDLVIRSGIWDRSRRERVQAVVANQTITYRKSLNLGDTFTVETRIAGVDERAVYFEQRFTVDGEIYAEAAVRMRFIRRGAGVVPMEEVLTWADPAPEDRVLPQWMREWAAHTGLPSTREPAPSAWSS
ncbi:acyl-CoA thioesterase [Catenuloplanes atrovinosus]|uniref:acyl-CoA thioesterase n=1 Tax=Catenuloplanes atrovinosus TaxID=137266 RepID=UPI00286C262B|nr:acyl-CoA thioesterase [Catenuloplanes atrovinosus]